MANLSIDFDSPQTSSYKFVDVTGTVPATETPTTCYLNISVTTTVFNNQKKHFYRTIPYTTTTTHQAITTTYTLTVSPAEMNGMTGTATYSFSILK